MNRLGKKAENNEIHLRKIKGTISGAQILYRREISGKVMPKKAWTGAWETIHEAVVREMSKKGPHSFG